MPRPAKVAALVDAICKHPGDTSTDARVASLRSAEARAMGRSAGGVVQASVDGRAAAYLEKVTLQAHRVTDEDVAALRAAGLSEDAIFELTLCSAVGASLARLDAAIALLDETS